ncbi:MAG: TldD/PmbA family protein, partial [Candidatus Heimdallarchaeota archaeon]|nr:TldD/PmbA family protein [Candidatus Heimdallarchaeota archaeon]MCK4876733.1 TldD/PmbA family protein [Candidatus Heimdallarchaeota archaeon]
MSFDDLRERILNVTDSALKFSRDLNIPSAEVFVFNQSSTDLSDQNGKIEVKDGVKQGVGIRVAIGKKLGFASCSGFEADPIKTALQQAHSMAKVSPENPLFNGFTPDSKRSNEGKLDPKAFDLDATALGKNIDGINNQIDRSDKRIIAAYVGTSVDILGYAVGTTEGCLSSTLSTSTGVGAYIIAMEAGERKTGSWSVSGREVQSLEGVGETAVKRALSGLGSKDFEGSEVLPTIWESRQASTFLLFPFMAGTSGSAFVEKRNPWKDKLDQHLAIEGLNVVDDGHDPEYNSTQAIDTEGTPLRQTQVVENGVLKSFLFNRMYGHAAGKESTGNARRQAPGGAPFESLPSTFPNKLVVQNGSKTLEDQIKELDKGILVTSL